MNSRSANNITNDFQHEARILNSIWLITALGLVTTAGLALVIIRNAALMSERPIWVISCLMIVLWSGIISHGRNKLLELAGKCHSEELWSPVSCAFTGALTLYYYFIGFFGILAAIAITLVWQRHTRFFH